MEIDEPCRFDLEVFDLEIIEGAVPDEIDGLLVQAVPDQVYLPEVEVLFPMTVAAGGDGAVRAFRIKDGCVDFRTRYVRTERFLLERQARSSLETLAALNSPPRTTRPIFFNGTLAGANAHSATAGSGVRKGSSSETQGPKRSNSWSCPRARGADRCEFRLRRTSSYGSYLQDWMARSSRLMPWAREPPVLPELWEVRTQLPKKQHQPCGPAESRDSAGLGRSHQALRVVLWTRGLLDAGQAQDRDRADSFGLLGVVRESGVQGSLFGVDAVPLGPGELSD